MANSRMRRSVVSPALALLAVAVLVAALAAFSPAEGARLLSFRGFAGELPALYQWHMVAMLLGLHLVAFAYRKRGCRRGSQLGRSRRLATSRERALPLTSMPLTHCIALAGQSKLRGLLAGGKEC